MILFLQCSLMSQYIKVQGKVTDAFSGESIAGATIRILVTHSAISYNSGNHTLSLKPGKHIVYFMAYGYTVTGIVLLANVFTPGADGKNDLWEIYYKGWDKVDVQIYSRWGVNVASYSLPAEKSWNGRLMNKGVLLPEGTDFYHLVASDFQTLSTKRVSGSINLIR